MLIVYIKRPTFSMKFWKSNFFQLIASQIQQKLLTSKLSRLWTFAVIGVFAWAKIWALKLLILRKKYEQYQFLLKKCIFTENSYSYYFSHAEWKYNFCMPSDVIQVIYPYTKKHIRFWLFLSLFSSNGQNKVSRHFSK